MKRIFLLLLCVFFSSMGFAQTGTISGEVHDKSTNVPIEYATVAVFSLPDSTFITGIITDSKGVYNISEVPYGKYYVSASFLGYKDVFSALFMLSESKSNVAISVLYIEPDNVMIDEVQIVGKQHQVDYKIDKKVITVNQSMTSASMTAVEVIESVPSIKVDVDGNVSLRGSSGFTVLIDGKPSVLDPSDVLRQIPATQIQSIEIITNPSAKYDPDGTGGIINIITKNNKILGWQGMVNVKAGSFGMYGGDFLLSYRQKKINTFFGADYGSFNHPRSEYSERRTVNTGVTSLLISDGEDERQRIGKSVRAGFELDASKNDALSFEVKVGEFQMKSSSEYSFTRVSDVTLFDTVFESSSNNDGRGGQYLNVSTNYSHNFKQPKHQITAEVHYRLRQWEEFSETRSQNLITLSPSGLYSTEDGPSSKFELKSDYTKPWKFGMIEAGIQLRNSQSEDVISLQSLDSASNSFVVLDSTLNTFVYHRNIYAAYGILNGRWDKLEYKIGARVENTQRDVSSEFTNEDYAINVWDVFPSVHASYKRSDKNQFMVSYSRRIDRPKGYYLEPFLTWTDMLHARRGNPDIQPEYIDAMEAGYIHKYKTTSLSLEAYYHIRHNKTERIEELYVGEASLYTFQNVGTDYSFGVEGMFNMNILPFWEISCMGNVYHYRIVDENEASSVNWGSGLHNTFRIKKNIKIQIDGMYHSSSVTSQGSEDGFYAVNTAIRADLFKRTLSVSLQARDVLSKGTHISIVETDNLYSYRRSEMKRPILSLTLSYKINNYKAEKKNNEGGGEGEEL